MEEDKLDVLVRATQEKWNKPWLFEMQKDATMVRHSMEDIYVGEQDQSHIHKCHKQANICKYKTVTSPPHGGALQN